MNLTTEQEHRRNRNYLKIGLLISVIGIVSGIGIQSKLDQSKYEIAENAYRKADCKTALEKLDSITSSWRIVDFHDIAPRAKAKQAECQVFQAGAEQQEARKFGEALMTYFKFRSSYPNSPLVSQTQQQTKAIFQQAEPAAIAQPNFCRQLDQVQNSIPQQNRPDIYYVCANGFLKQSDNASAIQLFEQLLKEAPQDPLAPKAKVAMAKAIVTEARKSGAKTIRPPAQIGQSAPGTTTLSLRNDSPRKIQLVFSGPQPRFEEIEACKDCQIYTNPPEFCPEKGVTQEFTLQPGEYDVVVRSANETQMNESHVKPFTSQWTLADGAGYGYCFYISRQSRS